MNNCIATVRAPTTRLLSAATLLALLGLLRVEAQTIDYAALEQLFAEPVTTSVTGTPQRSSQVAATMTIITADDIRRAGARDIPTILDRIVGVDAAHNTRDHADVSIRGYNEAYSPRLLVLVDGRQVYADYYGFTPWSALPVEIDAIRQIEVVKGPNSALFGFNAVGGVVNIVTYDPLYDDIHKLTVTGGTQDHAEASLVTTWDIGSKAGLRLSAGHRNNDDFSTVFTPSADDVRRGNERNALSLELEWQAANHVRLGLEASYSDAEQTELIPLYQLVYNRYKTYSLKSDLAADTDLGLITATAYTNRIKSEAFSNNATEPGVMPDNSVSVLQLQSISKVASDHTVRLSAEYRHNSIATTRIEGGDVSYEVAAAGGMWEWRLNPALTWTTALRLDHWRLRRSGSVAENYPLSNADWKRTESEWSFNTGLIWRLSDADTLRFIAGRGVQVPNLLALGGLVIEIPGAGFAGGVPDLETTTVQNYELSWDRSITAISGSLRTSLYHGRSQNIIANAGGARPMEGLFGLPLNIGDSRTAGIELSVNGRLAGGWRWGTSYAGQLINDDFASGVTQESTLAAYEDTSPKHVFRANLGWAHGPWEADAYLRYQSRAATVRRVPGPMVQGTLVRIPDHVALDGRVAYAVNKHLTLAVSGQNLGKSEQQQAFGPDVERMVFATFSVGLGSN